MADDAAERLRLLESIQSLLSPTLPSPPPSPPLEHDHKTLAPPPPQGQFLTASASISSFKRKLGDDDEPTEGGNKMVVGLGLGEGTQVGGEDTRLPRSRVPTGNDHSSSKPPTPDLRSSPFPAPTPKLRNNTFPSPTPQSPVFGKPGEDWRITFPKDRLRKLATSYREKGRELKHSGDKIARESRSSKETKLALAKQTEAILLYVFAFWCDDQAAKTVIPQNWHSIFGLITFVKRAAEKAGLNVLVALCLRMEALAVYTLSMHDQKGLNFKGVQLNQSVPPPPPPPASSVDPRSTRPPPQASQSPDTGTSGPSPPSITTTTVVPPSTSQAALDLIKLFTKSGPDLFRVSRLWEESSTILSPYFLSTDLPLTWQLCIERNLRVEGSSLVLPTSQKGVFAWPMELNRTMAVCHTVGFARCVLEEWTRGEELEFGLAEVVEAA